MKGLWVVVCSLFVLTGSAAAQDGPATAVAPGTFAAPTTEEAPPTRLAVAAAARGLAIGKYNLLLGGEVGVSHFGGNAYFAVVLPLRFGITEDFEIFAGPVLQSTDPVIHEPAIGLLYRFTHGDVEIGARVGADLAAFGPEPTQYEAFFAGMPARIHVGRWLAIDTGFQLDLTVNAPLSHSIYGGLLVPIGATFSITENVFASVSSGLFIPNFADAGNTIGAPLGVAAGYTIADGDRPLVDIGARVAWDNLRDTDRYMILGFGRFYLFP